jgi:uncharacterized protein YhaN
MKILALRLAEVGPFREPVAIEGFSGGFDVLAGPNELGKSTLFTALRTLLAERHTATSQKVATLRPEHGGAPLIEADLEIRGRRLRMRKRFLAQRMAVLQDLDAGRIWHGADAETEAERILASEAADTMRSLLWVAQKDSFELPRPDATLTDTLSTLIEQEAADTAGSGHTRRLADAVRTRLELLVTLKQGRAKAGGALDIARRRHEELASHLATARDKAALAEARLEQHAALRAERERATDGGTAARLATRAQSARSAVQEADKARDRLRLLEERVVARQLEHDRAASELARYEQRRAELDRAIAALNEGTPRLEALHTTHGELETRIDDTRRELTADEASLVEIGQALQAARDAQRRAAARAELTAIEHRLAQAEAAVDMRATAESRLAVISATEPLVEAARRFTTSLQAIEARIDAQATWADMAYLPDAAGRLRIDGTELDDGARIRIDRPIRIVIDGIGTITLSPGGADAASLSAQRTACMADLTSTLAAAGAATLAEAETLLAERRQIETAMREAGAQITALAPSGIAALAKEREAVAARAGDTLTPTVPGESEPDALVSRARALEADISRKRTIAHGMDRELRALAVEIGRLETQLATAAELRAGLEAQFPADEPQSDRLHSLREALSVSSSHLTAAVREQSAWAEVAPSPAAYEALVEAESAARNESARHAERCAELDRELATLEGGLRRDGEEGVGADIAGLEEALAAARARLSDLETDVEALNLLAQRLEQAATDHRERILRPLVTRLEPLLARVLPGASLTMDGPLLAVRLDRGERTDPLARLSSGTREQIATLVRLAYADMMAARGHPLPLVLDDALAFSDDTRLAAMFAILADAARRHQVIVLSCHQRAIAPLVSAHDARELRLEPWRGPDSPGNARG